MPDTEEILEGLNRLSRCMRSYKQEVHIRERINAGDERYDTNHLNAGICAGLTAVWLREMLHVLRDMTFEDPFALDSYYERRELNENGRLATVHNSFVFSDEQTSLAADIQLHLITYNGIHRHTESQDTLLTVVNHSNACLNRLGMCAYWPYNDYDENPYKNIVSSEFVKNLNVYRNIKFWLFNKDNDIVCAELSIKYEGGGHAVGIAVKGMYILFCDVNYGIFEIEINNLSNFIIEWEKLYPPINHSFILGVRSAE